MNNPSKSYIKKGELKEKGKQTIFEAIQLDNGNYLVSFPRKKDLNQPPSQEEIPKEEFEAAFELYE